MKHFEFTGETSDFFGKTLHRIRATESFGEVKKGEVGGWIEKEKNLIGDARVYGDAQVSGNARVYGDALIKKCCHICQIGPIGSRYGFTTFFRSSDNKILVNCGCFSGTIDEFEKKVHEVHAGTKHENTYMLAIEVAKAQIEDVEV